MIEVKNLVKKYGTHAAVNDLSFTVETGKVVGFLGPNGAGKSTTMNMITGYIAPTEGEVLIDGIDIMDEPELAKENIGYLPEIPPLYPDLKVREYLSFVAELKRVPKKERDIEVHKIMSKTKTLDVSERLIKHLSKGYKQRVGLAGAMMGNPDILILDEPTVGLDPSQIIEMRELIRELSKNHTVLLSSHIMQEISAVCDEIIIINEGKMITKDTPENITKKMVDTNGVHIVVKGDKTKIKEALRTVSGIKNVSYDNEKENEKDTTGLTIYCAEDEDIRVELFYALAKAECPLIEMNKLDTSLEDAFLALTRGGSKQYGGRKFKKLKSEKKSEDNSISDENIELETNNTDKVLEAERPAVEKDSKNMSDDTDSDMEGEEK
ncbi:ABC transporter ATP-binding protein [Eubacterium sp. MSJ-13]|uniref:ABC transporter ATP-binding protein n=1 Tax=Eubacterium sp. MSJ-13 TaxID=2841513 RepID=UPI001C111BF9|nr:ABC transporter ATP-binding protein [Eubacterium sp. MSJ-13]